MSEIVKKLRARGHDTEEDARISGAAADEITRLEARVAELEKGLREMKKMAEYWINLGIPERGCSKERYDIWLLIGHHSKAMSLARALLTPAPEKEPTNE